MGARDKRLPPGVVVVGNVLGLRWSGCLVPINQGALPVALPAKDPLEANLEERRIVNVQGLRYLRLQGLALKAKPQGPHSQCFGVIAPVALPAEHL